MLDDIKKILEVSKKGIVVMEDGKPAYVVVPFEDYIENTKNEKSISVREEGNHLLDAIKEKKSLDQKIPSIENIFEDEVSFSDKKTVMQKNDIMGDGAAVDIEEPSVYKKDIREIRLEDLPF